MADVAIDAPARHWATCKRPECLICGADLVHHLLVTSCALVASRAGEDPELTAAEDEALNAEADEFPDAETTAETASDEL
jgi:hypothetical protein